MNSQAAVWQATGQGRASSVTRGTWRWLLFGLCMALSLLSGCATSKPKQIDISQAQLQEMVNKRFPYQARWLDAIEITATAPKLLLQPGAGTVSANIDVAAADRVFNRQYRGSLQVVSGLRYEPSDNTFRFSGVKVDRFGVQGLPAAYAPETARLGALLAEQLLENYVIYALTPQQSQTLRDAGLKVSAMRISEAGLSITLSPAL
jgi:hypothetical protein